MQRNNTEADLGTQYTRQLVEDARTALAENTGQTASGLAGFFESTPGRDRDLLAREKIRREIVREVFADDSDLAEAAGSSLSRKIAKLLRLG